MHLGSNRLVLLHLLPFLTRRGLAEEIRGPARLSIAALLTRTFLGRPVQRHVLLADFAVVQGRIEHDVLLSVPVARIAFYALKHRNLHMVPLCRFWLIPSLRLVTSAEAGAAWSSVCHLRTAMLSVRKAQCDKSMAPYSGPI